MKQRLIVLALAMFGFVFAGCSNNEDSQTNVNGGG